MFYVYVLFRPWDGSPFYVGKGHGARWRSHEKRGSTNRYFARILAKSAKQGAEIPKVVVSSNLAEGEAFAVEKAFISAIGRGGRGPLVNLTDGGEGACGAVRSNETRARMSAAAIGNKNAAGCKRSAETKQKLRMRMLNATPSHREKISAAHRGKKLTIEHRSKLSAAKKGKSLRPEHVAKIAAANTGKRRSPEFCEKMRAMMLTRSAEMPHPR